MGAVCVKRGATRCIADILGRYFTRDISVLEMNFSSKASCRGDSLERERERERFRKQSQRFQALPEQRENEGKCKSRIRYCWIDRMIRKFKKSETVCHVSLCILCVLCIE